MAQTQKQKARMEERYEKTLKAAMKTKYAYKNDYQIPKLDKIVINMGVGEATTDKKHLDTALKDLAAISGQKPVTTKARKANLEAYRHFEEKMGVEFALCVCLPTRNLCQRFQADQAAL